MGSSEFDILARQGLPYDETTVKDTIVTSRFKFSGAT